jgi:hypothetical protein
MDNKPDRFVDNDDMLILKQDIERQILAFWRGVNWRWHAQHIDGPGFDRRRGIR